MGSPEPAVGYLPLSQSNYLEMRSPSELETHLLTRVAGQGALRICLSVNAEVLGGHSHAWLLNLSVWNLNSYHHTFTK